MNVVKFADNLATKLAFKTSMKMDEIEKSKTVKSVQENRTKILQDYVKKKKILQKYIKSAPFTKFKDKITFIFGVFQVILVTFFMGRYPNSFYYDFHTIWMISLVTGKWAYYKTKGWHYFMTDVCYYDNFLLMLFL